jgi:hemolysin III
VLVLDLERDPLEAANTITHGLGAVLSAAGGIALVATAALRGDSWQLLSAVIYSCTLVLLYTASTLFHWERDALLKRRLEILDHCAIFGLIAGTYTPFLMVTLGEGTGYSMAAAVWALAALGVGFKLVFQTRFRLCSTLAYIAMGWLIVLVAEPMLHALPLSSTLLLVGGGLAYTAGTYFFCNEHRIPYAHAIWHLFVLAGSACHFAAVAGQVIPG